MGFYNNIAKDLIAVPFKRLLGVDVPKPESLLGLMMGLSINNTQMIRSSLIEFIGDDTKPEIINGMFGIFMNDLNA